MRLTQKEGECVHLLAQMYQDGNEMRFRETILQKLGLTRAEYDCVMGIMIELGVIVPVRSDGEVAPAFHVAPAALALSRELHAQDEQRSAPQDVVAQVKDWARRNPWTAWPIIGLLALGFLLTVLNALLDLLERMGLT